MEPQKSRAEQAKLGLYARDLQNTQIQLKLLTVALVKVLQRDHGFTIEQCEQFIYKWGEQARIEMNEIKAKRPIG